MSQQNDSDGNRAEEGAPATGAAQRVVALLEAVVAADTSVGVRELARQTGIDKSAVSRLLIQLQRLGMVEQVAGVQGRYTIGPRLFAIASIVAVRDSLVSAARPILRDLVNRVDETCYLATLEHNEMVFRAKADCHKPIRYVLEMGRPMPLHAGAGGRAVLSGMDLETVAALLGPGPLERLTPRTVVDPAAVLALVVEDQERGYSVSLGERLVGGSAIASPYFEADGAVLGALVLTIPAERLDVDAVPTLGAAVDAARRELSARLGYRGPWAATRPAVKAPT